eukprot:2371582-Rhodomonas_salina.2
MICETRRSELDLKLRGTPKQMPVETQRVHNGTMQVRSTTSDSTIISAVLLYDCMPRTATPILWSTQAELTAQARDRTQCQCPLRSPPVRVIMSNASELTYMERHRYHGC